MSSYLASQNRFIIPTVTCWSSEVSVVGEGEMFSPIFASKLVGEMASERYHTASSSDTTADHHCSPVSELGDQSDGKSDVSSSAEMLIRDELAADEVDSEASEVTYRYTTHFIVIRLSFSCASCPLLTIHRL